jgi:hypothetical protein
MDIDVIGAPFEDEESIENWMEDEVERRMRLGRDPTFDYMNRDPRHPERYPMGSGGEVNYGLRARETINPNHTSGETFMGVHAHGGRARLWAEVGYEPSAPSRVAYGYYDTSEESAALASLGFIGHSGLGDDDAIFGAEAMQTMFIDPTSGLGDLDGVEYYGEDDYGFIQAVADDAVETFMTSRYDGMMPSSKLLTQLGWQYGLSGVEMANLGFTDYHLGDIGAFKLPKIKMPKLPDVKKAVGGALKAAGKEVGKVAAKTTKAMSEAYKKVSSAMDINKGKKEKMIAELNQIRGKIDSLKAKGLKSPKSQSRLKELEKEYAEIIAEAKKKKINCDELEQKQKEVKASGVAVCVGLAAKAKYNPSSITKDSSTTPKSPSSEPTKLSDIGIAPVVVAGVALGAAAIALGAALAYVLSRSGKLKTKCSQYEKEIQKNEEDWTEGEKVPFDPKTQPYTDVIKDPDTGKVLGVRVGDTLKMSKDTTYDEIEKAKEVATEQKGAASFTVDPETGMVTGGATGIPAITEAKAAAEQGTLLGKLGLGKIPWYVWGGVAAAGVAVIYVLATKKKPAPPQQPGGA